MDRTQNRISAKRIAEERRVREYYIANKKHRMKTGFGALKFTLARIILNLTGLMPIAKKNSLDIRLNKIEIAFDNLPAEFDGCKLLYISDTHLDKTPGLCDKLIQIIKPLQWDYCLLGGDYFTCDGFIPGDIGSQLSSLAAMLIEHGPVYAVLGNHDFMMTGEFLENKGVTLLINGTARLNRNGQSVLLAGIDDCFRYKSHDIEKVSQKSKAEFSILLSHGPHIYTEAQKAGFSLCLCGHTHAGQVCLPRGFAISKGGNIPRYMLKGLWKYNGMTGYTTAGAGCSGFPARLNCPGEVTIIKLRKNKENQNGP